MKQCMEQCMRREPPPYAEMALPSYTSIDMEDEIDMDTPISQESVQRQALAEDCARSKYSCLCVLNNTSQFSLSLRSAQTDEHWVQQPPQRIYPGETVAFGCTSDSTLQGVNATLSYEVCVNDCWVNASLQIQIAVPAIGRNKAQVLSAPEYIQCFSNTGAGNNCECTFEISSTVQDQGALTEMRRREMETEEMKRAASAQKFKPNRKRPGRRNTSNLFNN